MLGWVFFCLADPSSLWYDVDIMAFIRHVRLFVDGACRGNPGPGAVGVVILDEQETFLLKHAECIGHVTAPQAEYRSAIIGLKLCAGYTRENVTVFSDCELLIKQMNHEWRIKTPHIADLVQEVMDARGLFKGDVFYNKVDRGHKYIRVADRLGKAALEGERVTAYPF
jgi:ribonuclease HI